jgi:anti-anti-sigma factor
VEITHEKAGDILQVTITGRLDAYWADHLSRALEEAVRGGAHRILLNMAAVSYMSSVGIRVLLRFHKQLRGIQGSFAVSNPSEAVKGVLDLAGLGVLLAAEAVASPPSGAAAARAIDRQTARYEVFDLAPRAVLRCRVIGEPQALSAGRFGAEHCQTIKFAAPTFGVGLGAFGAEFAECQGRFGEFLAAAGAAAYLPTDGSNVPDYVVSAGALVPELHVLYALACEGPLAQLARFEAQPGRQAVQLSEIADACLGIAAAETAGIVMVAESAGLMGAALRRSPAGDSAAPSPFGFPQIRDWLSFTPERAFPRSLALVVGVATRARRPEIEALVRPLAHTPYPAGHFHAAAFSYRPLQKGRIELPPTVATLFEAEALLGVLHLLSDDRAVIGAGQSEFVRGACWVAPIAQIVGG